MFVNLVNKYYGHFKGIQHLPVGLQNVNDANVDQQPFSFSVAGWNTSHTGKSGSK